MSLSGITLIGLNRTNGDAPSMWVRGRQFSGRIVTLNNGVIFNEPIYNYSRDFPYLWEEMDVPVPGTPQSEFCSKPRASTRSPPTASTTRRWRGCGAATIWQCSTSALSRRFERISPIRAAAPDTGGRRTRVGPDYVEASYVRVDDHTGPPLD